jgi:hypothetical protein
MFDSVFDHNGFIYSGVISHYPKGFEIYHHGSFWVLFLWANECFTSIFKTNAVVHINRTTSIWFSQNCNYFFWVMLWKFPQNASSRSFCRKSISSWSSTISILACFFASLFVLCSLLNRVLSVSEHFFLIFFYRIENHGFRNYKSFGMLLYVDNQ